jgi:hypothetical protein
MRTTAPIVTTAVTPAIAAGIGAREARGRKNGAERRA